MFQRPLPGQSPCTPRELCGPLRILGLPVEVGLPCRCKMTTQSRALYDGPNRLYNGAQLARDPRYRRSALLYHSGRAPLDTMITLPPDVLGCVFEMLCPLAAARGRREINKTTALVVAEMEDDDPEDVPLQTILEWLDVLQPNAQEARRIAFKILDEVTGSVATLSEGPSSIRVPVLLRVCKEWHAALLRPTGLREAPRRTQPFDSCLETHVTQARRCGNTSSPRRTTSITSAANWNFLMIKLADTSTSLPSGGDASSDWWANTELRARVEPPMTKRDVIEGRPASDRFARALCKPPNDVAPALPFSDAPSWSCLQSTTPYRSEMTRDLCK